MEREKRFLHLFYGIAPIFIYYGITLLVVQFGRIFQWKNDELAFVNGLLNLIVLYFLCYREYNKRGGSRELPPLFPMGKETKISRKIPKRTYVWIVILGVCSSIAINNWFSIMGLFEKITTYQEVADDIYQGNFILIFVRTAILAAFVEEIMIRGLFYRGFSCVVGRIPGIIGSALVFGLIHGNLLQGMYAFILGVLFAYVYDMYNRNLLAPILAHMSANVLSVLGTLVPCVSLWLSKYFYILTGISSVLMIISVVNIYSVHRKGAEI